MRLCDQPARAGINYSPRSADTADWAMMASTLLRRVATQGLTAWRTTSVRHLPVCSVDTNLQRGVVPKNFNKDLAYLIGTVLKKSPEVSRECPWRVLWLVAALTFITVNCAIMYPALKPWPLIFATHGFHANQHQWCMLVRPNGHTLI